MGITFARTPFELYSTLTTLADPDAHNLEELTLVGRETVDGVIFSEIGEEVTIEAPR